MSVSKEPPRVVRFPVAAGCWASQGRRESERRGGRERSSAEHSHSPLPPSSLSWLLAPSISPIDTSSSDRQDAFLTPNSTDSARSDHAPCFFDLLPLDWARLGGLLFGAMMSSPMVLSLLLLASLTALLLLVPRLSPPPPRTTVAAAAGEGQEEASPAAGVAVGGGGTRSGGVWGGVGGVGEEADDLALFRRATLDAGAGEAAAPKVAFLFLTNSDLTFAPLWERFFSGHEGKFTVYVHADPAARLRLPPTPLFRGRFVAAKPTRRGDPTLIAAARRLLAAALLDDPANAYFALLSQHCVPLHSFARLYGVLFPPPPPRHHRRLPSYIEVLTGEPQMPSRYVARGEDAMLPEVPYDRFRIGSQFFTLARRHAALVVRERRLWRKFRVPCLPEMQQDSCYPEEHYFPTLLDMADPAGVARYTLTRVNWTDSVAGHPHTYTAPEVTPRLIAELRASNHTHPYMFARKFAPDCLGPLLAIADTIIFKD